MNEFLVYLSGPIQGLTYGGAQTWRDYVARQMPQEIRTISPLRGDIQRMQRESQPGIITDSDDRYPLISQRGLTARDRFDCLRSHLVFMNLLGAKQTTIGTMIELAWADSARIPVVLVMEKTGNVHDHPMVRDLASYRVETLDEAIRICEIILLPDGHGTRRPVDAFAVRRGYLPGSQVTTHES